MGLGVMCSRLGSVGVSPYAEDEPAYTTRRTLASRAATSRFKVAVTQFTWVATGSATDRGTEAKAASWNTTSIPLHAAAHAAGSARSPSRNSMASRPARLARLPVMKLSTPRTDSPRASKAAAMDRPMNPAAPVTRYFANDVSPGQNSLDGSLAATVSLQAPSRAPGDMRHTRSRHPPLAQRHQWPSVCPAIGTFASSSCPRLPAPIDVGAGSPVHGRAISISVCINRRRGDDGRRIVVNRRRLRLYHHDLRRGWRRIRL